MYKELLSNIGLNKWESQTYLALLELGSTTTGPLVRKSEVPQSKIYAVLASLNKKALVNHIIIGKTKYFQATDPQRILTLFKEKQREIEKVMLELKAKQKKELQSVELYEGIVSIRNMLLSMLGDVKKGEEYYGFSTGIYPEEANKLYHWWGIKKNLAGLKDQLLISLQNKKLFEKSIEKKLLKAVKKTTKYSKISFPGDVAIFRNQVIILNWQEPYTATLITSQNLSQQYKAFFKGAWKSAT